MKFKSLILIVLIFNIFLLKSADFFSGFGAQQAEALLVAGIAVFAGYKIKQALEEEDIEKKEREQAGPNLLEAAKQGDFQSVSKIIKMGDINIDYKNANGDTPLMVAIKQVNDVIDIARSLTSEELKELPESEAKSIAEINAIRAENLKIKAKNKEIIDAIEDIKKGKKGENGILDYLNIIELLLENEATLDNIRDKENFTPRMLLIVLFENLHDFIIHQKYIGTEFKSQSQLNETDKKIFEKLKNFEKYLVAKASTTKRIVLGILHSFF